MIRLVRKLWQGPWLLSLIALSLPRVVQWPGQAHAEDELARLHCVAGAVALDQQLYARTQRIGPPAFHDDVHSRPNSLHRYARGLTQSNDRHSQAFRPIMIAAEAARDAAVARNAKACVDAARADLQTRHHGLFNRAAT